MTLKGGKVNKALKDWVMFVKEVQRKNNLNYKDAIIEAKRLKDKGVKWRKSASSMKGGEDDVDEFPEISEFPKDDEFPKVEKVDEFVENQDGGKRRTRKHKKRHSRKQSRKHSRKQSRRHSRKH